MSAPPPIAKRADSATSTHSYRISGLIVLWITIGIIANLPVMAGDPSLAQMFVGVVGLTHCAVYFWRDGARRITAPGIYLLGSAIFAFYPGLSMVLDGKVYPPSASLAAINIAFWVQLILVHMFWEPRPTRDTPAVFYEDCSVTQRGAWIAVLLIAAGFLAVRVIPGDAAGVFGAAAVFVGAVLLSVSLFLRAGRISPFSYLIVTGAFFLFAEYLSGGFGRLILGSLGIAIVVAAAPRWRGFPKVALLVAFPPVLAYLAADRVQFTAGLNPNQSESVTGFESVISPFVRFSQTLLLETTGEIPHSWGASFFTALVAMVPRQLWPEKPVGFGAEVALFFSPSLAGTGHSELVLFYGEWVWAFGFLGLGLMIPVIGLVVRVLDNSMVRALAPAQFTSTSLLMATLMIVLAASIVDLFWGGAFTYVARIGPRVLIVGLLLVLAVPLRLAESRPLTPAASSYRRGREPR